MEEDEENTIDEDVGLMLWKIESIEKFFPCYKSMMEQE